MSRIGVVLQSQRPMSNTEGQGAPEGPVQEPNDRWLGSKGPGQIDVGVKYTVRGNGELETDWDVDARKALPSPLPMFIYRLDPSRVFINDH